MPASAPVQILAKHIVRPLTSEHEHKVIHLTPWDLKFLNLEYTQKGLLFHKPQPTPNDDEMSLLVEGLLASFSKTLDLFYPLAGRFVTTKYDDNTISISLECNDEGAEFIHARAPNVTVADIEESRFVPTVVRSFFSINYIPSYDGHTHPMLAAQVTELADGIFIGLSLNHAIGDGTSFWHFMNTWSEISRNTVASNGDSSNIILTNSPPILDRWFAPSCTPPIKLPFADGEDYIKRRKFPEYTECAFNFSASAVAQLKAKANKEMDTNKISSLQAVLAHLWRSVTRARNVNPEEESSYSFLIGCRARVSPPLPSEYLGNSVYLATAKAKVGDFLEKGLGYTAWVLNRMIVAQNEEMVMKMLEEPFVSKPSYMETMKPWDMLTGSSPRFNVYVNDFGWGKPVTVRSGVGNKGEGKATIYTGPERGSMALEVAMNVETLKVLIEDHEFMELVSQP